MIHIRLKLNISLIKTTSGRSLGTFRQSLVLPETGQRRTGKHFQTVLFRSRTVNLSPIVTPPQFPWTEPPLFLKPFRFSLQGTSMQDDPTVTATCRTSNGAGTVAIRQIVCDIQPLNTVHLIFNGRLQPGSWTVDWAWRTNRKTTARSRSNSMSFRFTGLGQTGSCW